ncbi:GNAT family N-acetyltransferase [Vibrio hangzhouensis]|uniref:Putative acetyltransferase n=1 Tax=Vibrio hangzhouensis TaxID=462991 RepID=A0A1H5YI97_9VIBR|nr:GNAT family N-acetyltransferase [Vibrio hangzhouensis]SEG23869.1 putative acetyltransferase [Vibrio hangzhouensis]
MLMIRQAKVADAKQIHTLFLETIRTVNSKDYNELQVNAWASKELTTDAFREYIVKHNPLVVTDGEQVLGYADIQSDGLIHHFYCHHAQQRSGIGSMLMSELIRRAQDMKLVSIYSYVSITAQPFFEHFGFTVSKPNRAEARGVILDNFLMEKRL